MCRLTKRYKNGKVTIDAEIFPPVSQEAIDREVMNSEPVAEAVKRLAEYEENESKIHVNRDLSEIIGDIYGWDAQMNQCAEECAELIKAMNKYRRIKTKTGELTNMSAEEARAAVVEELADTAIMLDQLSYFLDADTAVNEMIRYKQLRSVERLKARGK